MVVSKMRYKFYFQLFQSEFIILYPEFHKILREREREREERERERERERDTERERDREISIGKNKEYEKEKIFYMEVLKNNPQKDKQSKNEVKRKR